MKKMLALTLALVMALGLCACGGDTTDNGDAPAENPETNSPAETVTLDLPPVEDLTGTAPRAIAGVAGSLWRWSVPTLPTTGPRWTIPMALCPSRAPANTPMAMM